MLAFNIANNKTPFNKSKKELHAILRNMLLVCEKDTTFSLEIDITLFKSIQTALSRTGKR